MIRAIAVAAALALSGCAFSSEEPLFTADQAAEPFAEGARFVWRFANDDPVTVRYRLQTDGTYRIEGGKDENPIEAVFIALPETPQEDYIVQARMEPDDDGRVYAFMWREGERFWIFSGPSAIDAILGADKRDGYCRRGAYGACDFATREDVLRLYRDAIYPNVVVGGGGRDGLIEQVTP